MLLSKSSRLRSIHTTVSYSDYKAHAAHTADPTVTDIQSAAASPH